MTHKGLGMTVVLEADGTLAGIFTDGDLRRPRSLGGLAPGDHRSVMTVSWQDGARRNARRTGPEIMEDDKIGALVVVDARIARWRPEHA